jgi:hypothetical protein
MMRTHLLASRRISAAVRIVVATAGCARAVSAQLVSTLDAGGVHVRYADSIRASAVSLTPSLSLELPWATFGAIGTGSLFDIGKWSTQGVVAGAVFTPALGPLSAELGASAGGSAHQDRTRTGQFLGQGRVHLMGDSHGVWVGGGAGRTWNGLTWQRIALAELGGWGQLGPLSLAATVTPTAVADTLRYADAEAGVRWTSARVELSASLGARRGDRVLDIGTTTWGGGGAVVWIVPHLAVVADVGTYPVDFTQGYPGGRYASVALRLTSASPARQAPRGADPPVAQAPPAEDPVGYELRSAEDGRRTIRIRAPGAGVVEVAGDFTDWVPIALTAAADGWWEATLAIAPGVHQMNFRVDGGAWSVPRGMNTLSNEFSGLVGLLVVR